MSYFDEVYLKRMNKDGETRQERVKTRKEKEFNKIYLRKTEYQANIYMINDDESNIICSLQPNKWNESQLISNLMIPKDYNKLHGGDILKIYQKIKDEEYNKIWLVLYCNDDITKGYSNYKIICLDSEINITNEYGDTIYTVPVKFVNSSSSLVQDLFSFTNTTKGYREPNRDEKIITSDFDFLKKDTYFEYKNKAFEIAGVNNISIDGVAYVSISERLVCEPEPRISADIEVSRDKNFFLNNK